MKKQMFTIRMALVATAMVGSLLFFGCEKDVENNTSTTLPNGAMKISAESVQSNDGTKTTVNGVTVSWVSGDEINLNGSTKTVEITDGTPYLADVDNSVAMSAAFPANIVSNLSGTTVTMNYPASYTYQTSGNKQVLNVPMVAYADAGSNELAFKHVNSTVEVRVKNNFGVNYILDSITLISNSRALSGTATVNSSTYTITTAPSATDANKKVMMTFGGGLLINNNETKNIQIPVIPGASTKLTVRVAGRTANTLAMNNGRVDAACRLVYVNSATITLARAKVFPAPCTMNTTVPAMKKIYPVFSISANKKVYFSKGNLRYNVTAGTWSFADHQWEYLGTSNNFTNGSIDLFGWGTGNNPTLTSTDASAYSSFVDWGNNSIDNTMGDWRTLTQSEWQYILASRNTGATVNGTANARFTPAKVNKNGYKNGIILFPDNFVVPASLSNTTWGNINTYGQNTTQTDVSGGDWETLERSGCIFLPAAGARENAGTTVTNDNARGFYWSSTSQRMIRYLYPTLVNLPTADNSNKIGSSVRLVQDVE